jgi:uridine kinase
MTVRVDLPGGRTVTVPRGTRLREVLAELPGGLPLGARVGASLECLSCRIEYDCVVRPVGGESREGRTIYRRSLCFLLALAVGRLHTGRRLRIGHSLGNGFFYGFEGRDEVPAGEAAAIKREMLAVVEQDLPIDCDVLEHSQAVALFAGTNQPNTVLLLEHSNRPSYRVSVCGGFSDLYHGPLAPSTGLLRCFDVVPYASGFLLRYPPKETPAALSAFVDNPLLFSIYREYKSWGKILQVSSVGELNDLISRRGVPEFVQVAEALQDKKIAEIADRIAEQREEARLVLIAGPSSSGKTTFAKKLSIQLRVVGRNPVALSLDDYFLSREATPRDENGDYDFEALEAIDIPLLNEHLMRLLQGEEVRTPVFDFRTGARSAKSRLVSVPTRGVLVLEGIHGLNARLTHLVPRALKHMVYVSALTQLNLDDHNRISTTDNRLVRRLVRDYQYRGHSPTTTLSMWDSVLRGEDRNIFPFQNSADSAFNSALDFELAVLKVYAEPLLHMVRPDEEQYGEARRLLDFLANFGSIPSHVVPESSILREFIGGSVFKY